LYAATDAVVATNYFYSLPTLHLTEMSRRYDAAFMKPTIDLHFVAYTNLMRMLTIFPFSNVTIHLNQLLALCSMVLNPAYYNHPSHNARVHCQKLHAAARRYIDIVDATFDTNSFNKSLETHVVSRLKIPPSLPNDGSKFPSFSYPLKNDIEWALEFAGMVEKCLKKNSQQFTLTVDHAGRAVFRGVDFVVYENYQWNPELDKLSADLRNYYYRRRLNASRAQEVVRARVVRELTCN
jgi:hypothetical protein